MAHPDPTDQRSVDQVPLGQVSVVDSAGVRGTVAARALQQPGAQVLMTFDGNRRVQIPVEMLHRREDGSYYLPLSLRELDEGIVTLQGVEDGQHDEQIVAVLPVVAEEVRVTTRQLDTGRVRIHKQVQTTAEQVDVPLVRDRVQVERVPVGRFLERPVEAHYRGNTLVIPVMEEVVVVEKRLRLREEIHVTTVREQIRHQESIPLQREEVSITREQAAREQAQPDGTAST